MLVLLVLTISNTDSLIRSYVPVFPLQLFLELILLPIWLQVGVIPIRYRLILMMSLTMVMAVSEIKIYSKFGEVTGEPMALVDIKKSIKTVTADNQVEPRSASDSCCDLSPDDPTDEQ